MKKDLMEYSVARINTMSEGFMDELAQAEDELEKADVGLQHAQGKYDVALWKYAAIRDMIRETVGVSPYGDSGRLKWRIKVGDGYGEREVGKYRFVNMKLGEAIKEALKEVKHPMTLNEIIKRLVDGNIRIKHELTRSVNAALMQTKGIEKTTEGKYQAIEQRNNKRGVMS